MAPGDRQARLERWKRAAHALPLPLWRGLRELALAARWPMPARWLRRIPSGSRQTVSATRNLPECDSESCLMAFRPVSKRAGEHGERTDA